MRHQLRFTIGLAVLLALVLAGSLAMAQRGKPSSESPATGLFDGLAPNMLRSDGGGLYDDGLDCVSVKALLGNGFYQVRTIANTDACKAQVRGEWRFFNVDFNGQAPGDLDADGTAETIEQAPGRFIASKAFVNSPSTTPVYILFLKVNADGSTTQDTAWELRYRNEATVSINMGDGSRAIFLGQNGAADATADLCEVVTVPKRRGSTTECQDRGSFDVPFLVTAALK